MTFVTWWKRDFLPESLHERFHGIEAGTLRRARGLLFSAKRGVSDTACRCSLVGNPGYDRLPSALSPPLDFHCFRYQWRDFSSCTPIREAVQKRLYARQNSGQRRSVSRIYFDAAFLAHRDIGMVELSTTRSPHTGHRDVNPLAGHRVDVRTLHDLHDARRSSSSHLLCALELVPFLSLYASPVRGCSYLSANGFRYFTGFLDWQNGANTGGNDSSMRVFCCS